MIRSVLAIMPMLSLCYAVEGGSVVSNAPAERTTSTVVDLSTFAGELPEVEKAIGGATDFSRDDALATYGRTSAASGRFDIAAAAYAMFLSEFGTEHPYSEKIANRLADCLFPFKYDQIGVVHTASGPRLDPSWRMGYVPRPEHLRQAAAAFELAASLAQDQHAKGSALLKLGWIHRVLGDWSASTDAWERCAKEAGMTKSAADSLWLAAENLEWANRPAEAVNRLTQLSRDFPRDARVHAAAERVDQLEAEVVRRSDWLTDPIRSLQSEVETRAGERSPEQVYRGVVQWLQRRDEQQGLIIVSRWACSQTDWPTQDRVRACFDLVDALVGAPDQWSNHEAVLRLQEIVELAPEDEAAVHAAMRYCRVLNDLRRPEEAERMMATISSRLKGSRRWEPVVLSHYAEWLHDRGENEQALKVLDRLHAVYPDYGLSESLEALRKANRVEGGR